jgi:bifunctional N-acetylglucosamine-1-phosphate-uridyltransferase/glucosamine-1-phosphate-acetyltransferase GlmU-like protein
MNFAYLSEALMAGLRPGERVARVEAACRAGPGTPIRPGQSWRSAADGNNVEVRSASIGARLIERA